MPRGFPDSFLLTAALRLKRSLTKRKSSGYGGPRPLHYRLNNLVLYKPILNFELRSYSGWVGKAMMKLGRGLRDRARRQVGVKTGALRASIRFSRRRSGLGEAGIKIGGYTDYALLHHRGSKPHPIIARNAPKLVFMSKTKRLIRTQYVMHPGTRPNRYLTDHLRPGIVNRLIR